MTVASSAIALIYVVQSVNYNNVPVLFALMGIWVLLNGVGKKQALAASLFGFAAIAKLPMLILSPIALTYLLIKAKFREALIFLFGLIAVALAFTLFLSLSGNMEQYAERVTDFVLEPFIQGEIQTNNLEVHKHDPDTLSRVYSKNLDYLLGKTWPVALSVIVIAFLAMSRNYLIWIITLLATVIIWHSWMSNDFYYYYFIGVLASLILISLVASVKREQVPLLVLAILLAIVSFAGSNTGIRNIVTSGAIVLPLSIAFCSLYESKRLGELGKVTSSIVALALVIVSTNYKNHTIYRDGMRSEMSSSFASAGLGGIYSTAQRVEPTDQLVRYVNQEELVGRSLLCINTIPMFHYLLDMGPKNIVYWRLPNRSTEYKLDWFGGELASDFILSTKVNVRDSKWPMTAERTFSSDKVYFDFYEEILSDPLGPYELRFENEVYALFEKR